MKNIVIWLNFVQCVPLLSFEWDLRLVFPPYHCVRSSTPSFPSSACTSITGGSRKNFNAKCPTGINSSWCLGCSRPAISQSEQGQQCRFFWSLQRKRCGFGSTRQSNCQHGTSSFAHRPTKRNPRSNSGAPNFWRELVGRNFLSFRARSRMSWRQLGVLDSTSFTRWPCFRLETCWSIRERWACKYCRHATPCILLARASRWSLGTDDACWSLHSPRRSVTSPSSIPWQCSLAFQTRGWQDDHIAGPYRDSCSNAVSAACRCRGYLKRDLWWFCHATSIYWKSSSVSSSTTFRQSSYHAGSITKPHPRVHDYWWNLHHPRSRSRLVVLSVACAWCNTVKGCLRYFKIAIWTSLSVEFNKRSCQWTSSP